MGRETAGPNVQGPTDADSIRARGGFSADPIQTVAASAGTLTASVVGDLQRTLALPVAEQRQQLRDSIDRLATSRVIGAEDAQTLSALAEGVLSGLDLGQLRRLCEQLLASSSSAVALAVASTVHAQIEAEPAAPASRLALGIRPRRKLVGALIGGLGGALIGFSAGGPIGAVIGAVLGAGGGALASGP